MKELIKRFNRRLKQRKCFSKQYFISNCKDYQEQGNLNPITELCGGSEKELCNGCPYKGEENDKS